MSDSVVVYNTDPAGESVSEVAQKLRASGVDIIEQQPYTLLVSGDAGTISRALQKMAGWSITQTRTFPHPQTRVGIRKKAK
jgi:hypothetical protein